MHGLMGTRGLCRAVKYCAPTLENSPGHRAATAPYFASGNLAPIAHRSGSIPLKVQAAGPLTLSGAAHSATSLVTLSADVMAANPARQRAATFVTMTGDKEMALSINTSNTATVAESQSPTSLSSAVRSAQMLTESNNTPISPGTLALAPDAAAVAASMAEVSKALTTPALLSTDASNIANALKPTMQAIVSARPDLANAKFDFQSSNGAILVVSSSLNASDKAWIQGQLNSNLSLVHAVQSFHNDAMAGYALFSKGDGAPLTQAQTAGVSQIADKSFSFLSLFQSVGTMANQFKAVLSAYQTPAGQATNFAQDPTSAAGFLGFMKTAQTPGGAIGDIFQLAPNAVMPQFFPDSSYFTPAEVQSLGLDKFA